MIEKKSSRDRGDRHKRQKKKKTKVKITEKLNYNIKTTKIM